MTEPSNIPYCIIDNQGVRLNGKSIFTIDKSITDYTNPSLLLSDIYREVGIQYPKFHKMDNLAKIGYLAAEILLRNTSLDNPEPKPNTGIILMNGSSSIDTDSRFQETISSPKNFFPSPSLFVYTLPNIVIGEICIRFKIQGEGVIFEAQSFDAEHIYQYLSRLFSENVLINSLFGWINYQADNFKAFMVYITKEQFTSFSKESFYTFTNSLGLL